MSYFFNLHLKCPWSHSQTVNHIAYFCHQRKDSGLISRIRSKVPISFQQCLTEGRFIRCWLNPKKGHFTQIETKWDVGHKGPEPSSRASPEPKRVSMVKTSERSCALRLSTTLFPRAATASNVGKIFRITTRSATLCPVVIVPFYMIQPVALLQSALQMSLGPQTVNHIAYFCHQRKDSGLFSRIRSKVLISFQQCLTEGRFIRCWLNPKKGHFTQIETKWDVGHKGPEPSSRASPEPKRPPQPRPLSPLMAP
ncbi:hypothetical protein MDA_GLEAN10021543 [Myotis davidii]|uniref:Uncharacterized protein n=1 Tax=Myotis davidii TaxID=225400 RepID=L5M8Z2_MYODS|nr:hypothetical protein MDA_GLEAN10021543 [Myotis davidii]